MNLPIMAASKVNVEEIINKGSSLEDSSLSSLSSTVDDIGGGTYNLLIKLGVWAVVIALVITGLKLIFSNAQNRNEAKSSLLHTIIGGLLIFAAVAIVTVLANLGFNLFK